MFTKFLASMLLLTIFATTSFADSIYGTAKYKDGSKVDGTATISTSWNGKKAFPKRGEYELDFGGKVGQKITVYVNGSRFAQITVTGRTRLNIVVP